MLVVFTALTCVVYLTDAIRRNEIHNQANTAVLQEIDEFRAFIDKSPTPLKNSKEVVEAYLSQEIPHDGEIMVGQINGVVVEQKTERKPGTPQQYQQLLKIVFTSPNNSGITESVHWGRVEMSSPNQKKPDYFVVAVSTADAYKELTTQTQILIGLGAVIMAIAILMAWLISNQIIIPIRSLGNVANQITDSDLTSRVPVTSDDEIADLARTFNRMLDRIDTAYKIQRQFIDDAGHELRTPITVVRGNLELLETATEEQRKRSIELCTSELDRMTRMVNDLLTLASADSRGSDFLHLAATDLSELCIDIEDKAHMLTAGRAEMRSIAEGEVLIDAQRITEAILELVRNAMKYTNGNSPITINSTNHNGQIRFSVTDYGIGIPKDTREQLFLRFKRGQRPESEQPTTKGAGLGLSIVKAIAEAHGGHPWVESTLGTGSTFGITIPTRPVTPEGTQP